MSYREDLVKTIQQSVGIDSLREKRILLTGCTGAIGTFLLDTLLCFNETEHANLTLYAAGRDIARIRKLFPDRDDLIPVFFDMAEPISFAQDVDYIIHAAGNAHPAAFNGDPVGTILGNIGSTHRLLEYGKAHGAKRFLFLSSGEVYSDIAPTDPRGCYPISKRSAENLCVSYMRQYAFPVVIARLCHTFGPHMTASDNRAHAQFFRNALAGEDIVMKSAGTQRRSYLYAADAVSGLLTVLIRGAAGEAYDIADDENRLSIMELAELIAAASGTAVCRAEPDAAEKKDFSPIKNQLLDGSKLSALGWRAAYSIKEGVWHTLQICRENRDE